MSGAYTESLKRLIEEFSRLPGIGPRTAERLGFYILNADRGMAMGLAKAITDVKNKTSRCKICNNLSEQNLCAICSDKRRKKDTICVVEQAKDVVSLEKTGSCNWVYHVLGGHIAPLEGAEPDDLTIDRLLERVRTGAVKEVIMATNPDLAGDGTALYISSLLRQSGVKITRLARGLPAGGTIEYANGQILTDAIIGRQPMQ